MRPARETEAPAPRWSRAADVPALPLSAQTGPEGTNPAAGARLSATTGLPDAALIERPPPPRTVHEIARMLFERFITRCLSLAGTRILRPGRTPQSSWPGLSRPSTSFVIGGSAKAWITGTSPVMTQKAGVRSTTSTCAYWMSARQPGMNGDAKPRRPRSRRAAPRVPWRPSSPPSAPSRRRAPRSGGRARGRRRTRSTAPPA